MLADADEKSVLLRLHDQLDEACTELTVEEMSKSFRPPIDPLKLEAAAAALVQSGLAVSIGRGPTSYRISRAGISEVERSFDTSTTINPSTGVVHRSYTERSAATPQKPNFDWTKWGTILAGVGILVTIVIAVFS